MNFNISGCSASFWGSQTYTTGRVFGTALIVYWLTNTGNSLNTQGAQVGSKSETNLLPTEILIGQITCCPKIRIPLGNVPVPTVP